MAVIINKPKEDETVGGAQQQPQQASGPAYTGMGSSVSNFNNNNSQSNQPSQNNAPKFTNIQQFLGANKGAASEVGNRVGGGVNRDIGEKEGQAQQSVNDIAAVRQGVEKNIINPGQQFQQNMSGQNFDPNAIVNNNDQFKQYYDIRTGNAQNQATQDLQAKQQAAQQSQTNLNQTAQQRLGQLGTETGRSGLLGEFVGKGVQNYNQGLGLLDQALMQRDPNRVVDTLKSGIQQKQNTEFADIAKNSADQQAQAQQKIQDAQTLGTGLQNKSNELESGFINNLQNNIGKVNEQRTAQQQGATNAFNALHTGQNANNLGYNMSTGKYDPNSTGVKNYNDFLNTLGLQSGQNTFNTFKNLDNVNQLAQFGRQANTVQDVANQQDVDKYNALAKLAFGDVNAQGQAYVQDPAKLKLTQASNLENAVSALQGQNGQTAAQQYIKDATDNFWNNASNQSVSGVGGMYTPDYGEIATGGQANVNLRDFLRGQGLVNTSAGTTNYGSAGNVSLTTPVGMNIADRGDTPTLTQQDIQNQITALGQGVAAGGGTIGAPVKMGGGGIPVLEPLVSGIGSVFHGQSGRDTSGTQQYLNSTEQMALNNASGGGLQQNILDQLRQLGYFTKT